MKLLALTFLGLLGLAPFAAAADAALKEGDCWSYTTRPGEETSYLVIQKIETRPAIGEVIHISVVGLKIRRSSANTDLVVQVGHLPIAAQYLRASLNQKLERTAPTVNWLPGYLRWIDAKGDAFTKSAAECIEDIELGLNPERAAAVAALESQLRLDLRDFLRARSAQKADAAILAKEVDVVLASVKSTLPTVLMAETGVPPPTDEALQRTYDELLRIARGEEARLPFLVTFYSDLRRANRLLPQQRILFDRLLRAVYAATQKRLSDPKSAP